MKDENRAGGAWVKPWSTLDHVRSELLHARALLNRHMMPGDQVLLTEDEYLLLVAIDEAIDLVERITK